MSDSPAGPPEKSSSQSPIPSSAHATALETAAHIQAGRLSAVTVAENAFERIAALDDDIQGFNLLTRSLALEAAADIDRRARAGETLPLLAGAPIAIKDNLNIAGLPTTCSSRILEGYVSPYDATVVQKVRAAGSRFWGKPIWTSLPWAARLKTAPCASRATHGTCSAFPAAVRADRRLWSPPR